MEQELRQMFEKKGAEMSVSPTLSPELRNRVGRQRMVLGGLVAAAALALVIGGFAGARSLSSDEALPPANPDSKKRAFVDTWVSTDLDGSTQTMVVRASGEDAYEIVVRDDSAGVCSGAPSTLRGTGRLDGATKLVIPSPAFTCDDGSEPQAESGPPLEEQLRNLTFVHDPESDTLTDNFGLVWDRGETTEASGGMWPQSSLEEAQRAQRLADEGDARYTWQVLPAFPHSETESKVEGFFTRFLQEKLGWEDFRWSAPLGLYAGVPNDRPWEFAAVRCAPGKTNPLYPNDPEGRECAPTIDDHRYETVMIGADQPVRGPDDPTAIWVVTRWALLQPSDAPITGNLWRSGDSFRRQVQQEVPPSESQANAVVDAFLQARLDGEGAEEYLAPAGEQVPLLYATTSDASYEQSEFELVRGPVWPGGWMEYKVRLVAEAGGTVVEQSFLLVDSGEGDGFVLLYGTLEDENLPTTENGEPLLEPYSILDGEVTLGVPPPWYAFYDFGENTIALDGHTIDGTFSVLPDPLPLNSGCRPGPSPADAEALARSIRSDQDLEATEPEAAVVGGIEALRMDVEPSADASVCDYMGTPLVLRAAEPRGPQGPSLSPGDRMRLYLLDLPRGSSARILAIAFVAQETSFETMLQEEEARIMDSFEFRLR